MQMFAEPGQMGSKARKRLVSPYNSEKTYSTLLAVQPAVRNEHGRVTITKVNSKEREIVQEGKLAKCV